MTFNDIFHLCSPKNFYKLFFLFLCWALVLISSTSQFGGDFINKASAASCSTNLSISGVTASGNQAGYPPSNVLDNSLSTRWSNPVIGSWIRADLGTSKNICSVDIAWYKGNERRYNFAIATSTDGTTFTNKLTGTSSGTTLNSEKYTFTETSARYVRITVTASPQTSNTWGSMTEVDIFGPSASLTSTYNFEPSLTLSGPP